MTEVVSVKFNSRGKAYYFDPVGIETKTGDTLVVETAKGLDIGECSAGNHYVIEESLVLPLRPVIRVATEDDLRIVEINKTREKEAFKVCKEKIADHRLDMKLVDVECGFEGNKILFFFTADGRVDFRELVKDLAAVFRTRIELRQIGVRDETKMLGGLGICGRPYCCNQFLTDFQPVSTKMAKTQSMSLNPTKISGSCGRLMCCLRYEQEAYEDLLKTIPKNGAFVQTTAGYGTVVQTGVLRQKIKVRLDDESETEIKVLDAAEVAVVPGGRPKAGEPMPQVLNYVAKPVEAPEPIDDPWKAPTLFAEEDGVREKPRTSDNEDFPKKYENRKRQQGRPRQQNGNQQQKQAAKPAAR
ncbi:MAG: stage 0 sporulation family protein, partial [Oscillospiraceae bacterium]